MEISPNHLTPFNGLPGVGDTLYQLSKQVGDRRARLHFSEMATPLHEVNFTGRTGDLAAGVLRQAIEQGIIPSYEPDPLPAAVA